MSSEDTEAQEDEMMALGSIMDPEVFSIHPGQTKSGQIQISLTLPSEFHLEIDATTPTMGTLILEVETNSNKKRLKVNHLPPLVLHFTLPADYPSKTKPSFTLSSCWLDRHALSILCKKLDEDWETNAGMAVLYSWYSFLRDVTLDTLGIQDTYDISWWYTSGPNAKSGSGITSKEESSKKHAHAQRNRVRTRSGTTKTNGNNVPEHEDKNPSDIPSSSSSAMPSCSSANLVPKEKTEGNSLSSTNDGTGSSSKARRCKRGASGEAIAAWLNESEGGAASLLKQSSSSTDLDLPHKEESVPIKQGKVLDSRAVFDWQSFSSILDYLNYFNVEKTEQEFKTTSQTCDICYIEKFGTDCIRFMCSHIFCTECVKHFFVSHITNGSIDSVRCPGFDCKQVPTPGQVRAIVGEELYERYDRLLLTRSLDSMTDVTFCPRPKCRYPAVRDPTDKIASCSACNYVFCPVCLMVYHGVEPCRFKADDKKEVYESYTSGNPEDKKRLEKIYGKKQLSLLVETVMSEKWVSNQSKPCPHCSAPIEKFEGCNKVTCFNCNTYFCWICCVQLSRENPYFHFNDPMSKCFNSLFEGVDDDDDEDDEFEDAYFSDDSEFY